MLQYSFVFISPDCVYRTAVIFIKSTKNNGLYLLNIYLISVGVQWTPAVQDAAFFSEAVRVAYGTKELITYEDHVNMQKVKKCNSPTDYSHKVARKLH